MRPICGPVRGAPAASSRIVRSAAAEPAYGSELLKHFPTIHKAGRLGARQNAKPACDQPIMRKSRPFHGAVTGSSYDGHTR
jgi:hypothetical protein